jgi:hypothetical protein
LDRRSVAQIKVDLTSDADWSSASVLTENNGIAFMGDTKGGVFDMEISDARTVLVQPNPNGRSNSVVLRPWTYGFDITTRLRGMYIIDFDYSANISKASGFERRSISSRNELSPSMQ